jgi:ubiquinone/menaquinone biosynthesis C-methylase UbiE
MEEIPGPFAYYYDWINRGRYFRGLHALFAEDVQGVLPPNSRLLDSGAGPGHLPQMIASGRPDLRIVALDLSTWMVALAQRRMIRAGLSGRVAVLAANAMALPFPGQSFDLALATMSYHHWADPVRGVHELLRVLKPDGRAWLYELDRDAWLPEIRAYAQQQRQSLYLTFAGIRVVALHSALRAQDFAQVFRQGEVPYWQVEKVHHIFWRAEIRPATPQLATG